jgi:hypothetical protein
MLPLQDGKKMVRVIKDNGTPPPENRRSPPQDLNKSFGITKEEVSRYVDTPFVIDVNKRTSPTAKPKFTK